VAAGFMVAITGVAFYDMVTYLLAQR